MRLGQRLGQVVIVVVGLALAAGAYVLLAGSGSGVDLQNESEPEAVASVLPDTGLAGRTSRRDEEAKVDAASTGTIAGVVRRGGKPVAAHVLLFEVARAVRGEPLEWAEGRRSLEIPPEDPATLAPIARADALADGSFSIAAAAPAAYTVVARDDEGHSGHARTTVESAGVRAEVTIELMDGGEAVSGRAVHADGRPFRGFVTAQPAGGSFNVFDAISGRSTATDDEGRFTIGALPAGPCVLDAYVPGRMRASSRSIVLPRRGEVRFVVDPGVHEVEGRVISDRDGQSIVNAEVSLSSWSVPGLSLFCARAVTEAEGRFKILVPPLSSDWRVRATGFATVSLSRPAPSEGGAIEFRLVRAGRVSGRVTVGPGDPSPDDAGPRPGEPVAGIAVYAFDLSGNSAGNVCATTDAAGRYQLDGISPGEVTVLAHGLGFTTKGVEQVRAEGFNPLGLFLAPEQTAVVDLVVVRAARATGRVLDAKETPVAGARVTASRILPSRGDNDPMRWLDESNGAATGPDGRFVLETLLPGHSYAFSATAAKTSPGRAGPLRVEAGKPVTVEIHLRLPRWADVRVESSDGKPIAGATAYVNSVDANNNERSQAQAPTGPTGVARVGPLTPGIVVLGAWCYGYSGQQGERVGTEESTDDIRETVTLKAAHSVAGVVRWADGKPAGGLVVEARGPSGSSTTGLDEDGTFRFDDFETDSIEIVVKKDWGDGDLLSSTHAKPGDEDLVITLAEKRPPKLLLRLVDADGKPVPRADVFLQGEDYGDSGSFMDGRVELALPVPDRETFALVHHAASIGNAPLPLGFVIAGPIPAKAHEFEIRLPPELAIAGVVKGADGRGVRGVLILAQPVGLAKPFHETNATMDSARSDGEGRFRIGRLAAGAYRLIVYAPASSGATDPVDAKAGQSDVVIKLAEGSDTRVTVIDPDGRVVPRAIVIAEGGGFTSVDETDSNGVARLAGLAVRDAQSTYRLDVAVPDDRSDLLATRIDAWRTSDDRVALGRAFRVRGIVRDSGCRPAARATVERLGKGGVAQRVVTARDGTFELKGLPEGEIRLAARIDNPSERSRIVVTRTGATDVVLALLPTTSLKVKIEGWRLDENGGWCNLVDEDSRVSTDWQQLGQTGVVTFHGLSASSAYRLFVIREGGDETAPTQFAFRTGIAGDAGEVAVPLKPGLRVAGRVLFPPGGSDVNVMATDGYSSRGATVEPDGVFRVEGLHEGTWTVHANVLVNGARWHTSAQVEAGAAIELEPKPPK